MRAVYLLILLTVTGLAAGCGGGVSPTGTGTTTTTPTGTSSGSNVLAIAVNGGPEENVANGYIYENAAFASATICVPGSTSSCVTIPDLLVDTGSTGLRVFSTAVSSLSLPAVNASNGSAAYDCVAFVDGSFMWGTVQQADVTLGEETASKVPIQVISSTATGVPTSCSNGSTTNTNTAYLLGANGILGVGGEPTDCYYEGYSACSPTSGQSSPPYPAYYTCSGTSCSPAFVATADQVANPVALFPTDNNGVIVELPAASTSEASVTGSLVFGIGTESNNQLASGATVMTEVCEAFTTVFDGQTYGVTDANTCMGQYSFIDSGSNALYFPNVPGITECSSNTPVGDLSGFYCPASTVSYSATMEGENGASKTASFSVANTESLFSSSSTSSDAVMPTLGGTNPTGYGFDWGLPFFYGVNLYSSIDGQKMPSGAPAAPWWAY